MVFDEVQIGELRGTVNTHIQQCDSFKKVLWSLFGIGLTINIAFFTYLIRTIDIVRDSQSEIKNNQALLERNDASDRIDLTNRLSVVVQASLQRETALIERLRGIEVGVSELRKEMKEESSRNRR